MQAISTYIAYLLTRHECVILPGLGAFVVSGAEPSGAGDAGFLGPPLRFLGFNPDIHHNDGLLADAVARGEELSYAAACAAVTRYVDQALVDMENQTPLQLAWVGTLALSAERKLLFTPAQRLSCQAEVFGLSNFYLPLLDDLHAEQQKPAPAPAIDERRTGRASFVRRWTAVAAAVVALLSIALPVNDHSVRPQPQAAMVLPRPVLPVRTEPVAEPVVAAEPVEVRTPYYIVVASLPTEALAQMQMEQLRQNGLLCLGIVSDQRKHRVYIARFADKSEANTFLFRFRNEQPKYQDTWLFIRPI
jgi:hypothetical protein